MKRNDLTGKKFGKLTVLECHGIDKFGQTEWLCECECGNRTIVKMNNLKRGHTTSCGCRKHERFGEDLTNKIFGRLIVLGFDHMGPRGRSYWRCECECGNQTIARRDQLLSGHTRSCGCYAIDMSIDRSTKHGLSKKRIYGIWRGMKHRCFGFEHVV